MFSRRCLFPWEMRAESEPRWRAPPAAFLSWWVSTAILPPAFGKMHPRWKTPYVSILVQAIASGDRPAPDPDQRNGKQRLSDSRRRRRRSFISCPLLYMYASAIKLAYRKDRGAHPNAVLIPGGKFGVWLAGSLGFLVVLVGIALSLIPPGESSNKWMFESKLIGGTVDLGA